MTFHSLRIRSDARHSRFLPSLLALLSFSAPRAFAVPLSTGPQPADPAEFFPYSTTELRLLDRGSGGTLPAFPGSRIWCDYGVWIGAEFNRGNGTERLVANTFGPTADFTPEPAEATPFGIAYSDTGAGFSPHDPLGLLVTQVSASLHDPEFEGFVRVRYNVKNISSRWRSPGWEMQNVYFAVWFDGDLGSGTQPWTNDASAFDSRSDGDFASIRDADQADDEFDVFGVFLPGRRVHAFRNWLPADDLNFVTEQQQYDAIRGTSDEFPTIDPPSANVGDTRILVSVGPVTIARGESRDFEMVLACDENPGGPFASTSTGVVGESGGCVVAFPNPVRRERHSFVRFGNLPEGATVRVFDVRGVLIQEVETGGESSARWDLGAGGRETIPGVYLYRIETAHGADGTGKLIVVR